MAEFSVPLILSARLRHVSVVIVVDTVLLEARWVALVHEDLNMVLGSIWVDSERRMGR